MTISRQRIHTETMRFLPIRPALPGNHFPVSSPLVSLHFSVFLSKVAFSIAERAMAGKIIVANYAALQKKYDVKALKPILAAADRLIVADRARGIVSKIVDIS